MKKQKPKLKVVYTYVRNDEAHDRVLKFLTENFRKHEKEINEKYEKEKKKN